MTIREAIESTDKLLPNQYTVAEKIRWLSMLDGLVHREIILTHEGVTPGTLTFPGYSEDKDYDTELMVPYPYDEVYRWWLETKINESNGETVKANISGQKYNAAYQTYQDYYNRLHMPLERGRRFIF